MGDGQETEATSQRNGRKEERVDRRKARARASDDWRQNGRKRGRDKQRTSSPEQSGVHAWKRAEEPAGGSQSVRSSEEAGNDRGAKGRRKVEA